MKMNLQHRIIRYIKFFQRSWLWFIVLFFAVLTLSVDQTAWAISIQAPSNQTVPTVTPTTEPTPVPTVTPTPGPTTPSTETNAESSTASNTEGESDDEAAPSFQSTDLIATVSVIALNMREADGTSSSIVGTVYLDTEVEVLARNEDTTWLYICCTDEDDLPGWVSSQFVQPAFDVLRTNELVPLYQAVEAESADETNSAAEGTDASTEATESAAEESSEESADTAETDASPTETPVTETSDEPVAEARPVELEPAALQFEMNYTPEYAWQNQLVEIEFIVTNISDNPAMNVNIRDELLSSLLYVSANAENDGIVETVTSGNNDESDDESGSEIFTITWPELAPQQQVRAVVIVRIAPDLVSGAVVDNLAAVGADNAPAVTGGMSVGMPPALLPDFR